MYKYKPLEEPRSIRLLNLAPSPRNNPGLPLSCELTELAVGSKIRYEALSYSWDAQKLEFPIQCEGKELFITANCKAALLHLRSRSNRMLWIDAICIDQSSEEERSTQVPLMGDVYSNASKVIIWIGESTPDSELAIRFLKDFFRISFKNFFRNFAFNRKLKQLEKADAKAAKAGTSPTGILESVFDRSWFQRMWTIQEVALARHKVVMCGSMTIEWDDLCMGLDTMSFRKALGKLSPKEEQTFDSSLACHVSFESLLRQRRNTKSKLDPPDLSTLLYDARRQEATNPKDVIYGIYSLLLAVDIHLPAPDYSKSVEQIYTETAEKALLQHHSLELLYQVASSRKFPDLPSWVPSFNESRFYYPYRNPTQFACSKSSTPIFELQGGGRLSVRGKYIDKIASCATTVLGWNEAEEFAFMDNMGRDAGYLDLFEPHVKAYREWTRMTGRLKSYPTGESVKKALSRTLVHDRVNRPDSSFDNRNRKWDAESFTEGFENWYAAVTVGTEGHISLEFITAVVDLLPKHNRKAAWKLFNEKEKQDPKKVTESLTYKIAVMLRANYLTSIYTYFVQTRMRECRFVITEHGFIGTAPAMAKVGDGIFLVSGLSLPMIIRQREDGTNILIGPAYVHGIMDGEKWSEDEAELEWIALS